MFLDLETKWRFGVKYAAFECRDFPNTYFSSSISWFSTGFWLFRPAEIRKRAGHGTLQKRQNMNTIKLRVSFSRIAFCEQSVFLILNFVKSPFFSHWILRRVRFFHIEICEMSENRLNFSARQIPEEKKKFTGFQRYYSNSWSSTSDRRWRLQWHERRRFKRINKI